MEAKRAMPGATYNEMMLAPTTADGVGCKGAMQVARILAALSWGVFVSTDGQP
jgi:hypothetical protein